MRLLSLIPGLALALIPTSVYAIPTVNWCPTELPCDETAFEIRILDIAIYGGSIFGIFLAAMFAYYAVKLLISTGDDNAQSEMRKAFSYAFFGVVLVAGAQIIANGLTNWGTIVEHATIKSDIIDPLVIFFETFVGAALIVTITFNAFRLILSEDESQSSTARKRFIESLIGTAVVILADTIVRAFMPPGTASLLTEEFRGIAQFIATIFGLLAVIAIIVGGIFLILSVQDSMKDRGKQIILGGIISLVVVYSSYAIVSLLFI